jgi:hypothetical protein
MRLTLAAVLVIARRQLYPRSVRQGADLFVLAFLDRKISHYRSVVGSEFARRRCPL